MNTRSRVVLFFLTLSFLFIFQQSPSAAVPGIKAGPTQAVILAQSKSPALKPNIDFGKIPLYFIYNKGQVNVKALFYAKTPGYTLWVTKEGLIFDSTRSKKPEVRSQNKAKASFRDVSRLLFIGANKNVEILPLKEQKLKVNYFKGNDKSKWVGGVPTSGAVLYKNLYKNIDLKVYGIGKQIEYDWIVKAGGDPSDIRFEYKNVKEISINKKGDLDITTQFGNLIHKKPFSYQESEVRSKKSGEKIKSEAILSPLAPLTKGGQGGSDSIANLENRNEIKSAFKKTGENTYGFTTGKYDKTKTLIIDPVILAYSTYLGGGSGNDVGNGIASDNNGYVYITGYTQSTNFPALNGYQMSRPGGYDVFVTKIDTNQAGASSLIYSSYLGGAWSDMGYGIAVDSSGVVYVTGKTNSSDFPIFNQYQGNQAGEDAFVTKIDTNLTGVSSLLYSTYLGGVSGDYGRGIAADNNGNAYVTGYTNSSNFPALNGYQMSRPGGYDAFVTKIDTNQAGVSGLIYSTYLGGGDSDYGQGITVDSSGYVYVTGYTRSTNFPILNGYPTYGGSGDAFMTKIDTTQSGGSSLLFSSYSGGVAKDTGNGIAVDNNGIAYVAGYTASHDFHMLNGYQTTLQGYKDAFITKIDTEQSGPAALLYSTYIGGVDDDDKGNGIVVDSKGNAYVTGSTYSTDFPTHNQYQEYQGGRDAFVTMIDTNQSGKSSLIYSTYLGGGGIDSGRGIAADNNGNAYVTGYTHSSDFPTHNQYQEYQGVSDAFVTKFGPYLPVVINNYSVEVVVSGEGGSVDKEKHLVMEGKDVTVKIYPDEGYEIDRIFDNGVEVAVSNPYVINDIQEDHTVEITFKKILYPPVLSLTGEKKVEKAWIVQKGYSELTILITEHDSPMVVSSYVLYKNVSGIWSEIKSYSGAGSYEYIDKYFGKDESVDYKLAAIAPDGLIVVETTLSL